MRKNVVILILILVVLLTGCSSKKEVVSKEEVIFGTIPVTIKIYAGDEELLDHAMSIVRDIDEKMSKSIEQSEISQINKYAGKKFVSVSQETYDLIKLSQKYYKISEGEFDITIGPLVELWDIGPATGKVPSDQAIEKALTVVNYEKILFDEEKVAIKLQEKGMILDLGGIAKGYAADEVAKYLTSEGIERAIINLGGNVNVVGSKSETKKWRVGIQNPLEPTGSLLGVVKVENLSVVTSGVYERYFIKNGVRYHHILSPETGSPVNNQLQSVSIITKKSVDADALSTVLFSLGLEKGLKMANSNEAYEVIFVTKENKVICSEGIKSQFELLNNDFELVE